MSLHPLAQRFADSAAVYERGRPEYAPAVAGAIAAELRLAPGAPVLDLAAGTGKLTRALVGFGLDVTAVEPQAQLREVLLARAPGANASEGVAEAIPLADRSVAAVTVADAFHWFDHSLALSEIRRVLRPGGGLAVLTTMPDWSGASWAHEIGTLISGLRPEHPQFDGPSWQQSVRASGDWSDPREVRISYAQPMGSEQLVDYLASISWIAALSEEERQRTLATAEAIVERHEAPAGMTLRVTISLVEPRTSG